MMPKNIPLMLVCFFLTVPTFATSVVHSEFEMILPKQFQQSLIEQKWKSLTNEKFKANWQFPDQEIQTEEVPVQLKGLSLSIETQLKKPSLQNAGVIHLQSDGLQARLLIDEVSVDHVVERVVSGIVGRFRVQASCKNVVLNMKSGQGQFSLDLVPDVGSSSATVTVRDAGLAWNPDAWTSENIQCTGVAGFDQLLKDEIIKLSQDSQAFVEPKKALLIEYVQNYLHDINLDFSKTVELPFDRSDIKVSMKIDDYKDLGTSGIVAKGTLSVLFTRIAENKAQTLTLNANSYQNSASSASLRLPKDFIKVMLTEAYRADTWLHGVSSNKLPGFSTIMNSRLTQWLVWPELRNFSQSANFLFNLYSKKDVTVSGESTAYQVGATVLAGMQAPKSGKMVPFMNFTLPFKSKVTVSLKEGTVSALFVNPTLGMTASWDSSYVNKYGPSTRFATSTIRDRIVGSLWGQSVKMTLPTIPLMEGLSLKVQSLVHTTASEPVLLFGN